MKDLKVLIALCRKTGVESIKVGDVELHLAPPAAPIRRTRRSITKPMTTTTDGTQDVDDVIDMPDELTQEQMLFFSVTPPEGREQ